MVSERASRWAMTASTADLLWTFHNGQAVTRVLRKEAAEKGCNPVRRAALKDAHDLENTHLRAIVAELRRRGHSVEWEE